MACDSNVISGADYKLVTADMANAKSSLDLVKSFCLDAVTKIVYLNAVTPEVDLLTPFWDTYVAASSIVDNPSFLLSAVSALESHVLKRCGYTTVDQYISSQVDTATVCPDWAVLSALAGFPITGTYIAESCA